MITSVDKKIIDYAKQIETTYNNVTKGGNKAVASSDILAKIFNDPGKIYGSSLAAAYPYLQSRKNAFSNFIIDSNFENLTLEDDDLINLAAMGKLVLRGEYLSYDIMEKLSQLVWLTEIDIKECAFEEGLTEKFASLKQLKTLTINFTNLETLPDNIDQLENLERLYLQHNSITSVPNALFENKRNLGKLDLSHNDLKTIPSSIVKCKKFINKNLMFREQLDINKNPNFLVTSNDPDNLGIYELEEAGIEPYLVGNKITELWALQKKKENERRWKMNMVKIEERREGDLKRDMIDLRKGK